MRYCVGPDVMDSSYGDSTSSGRSKYMWNNQETRFFKKAAQFAAVRRGETEIDDV